MAAIQLLKVLKRYSPFLIGFLLFLYVVIRAIILPVTHDESNTCLVYSTMSLKDIMSYKIPIPNNHIVNTLLIKLSTWLFGCSNLSVRLPNVLGFLLYYFSVLTLLKKMNDTPLFILFGIVMMCFNPFLLDFFSMARGYALAIAFITVSIVFAVNYLETPTIKNVTIAIVFAAIGVYTNFTILNFYVAFAGVLGLIIVTGSKRLKRNDVLQRIVILSVVTIVLAALSYIPVKKMLVTDQFHFWKAGGFYSGTITSLIISSSYQSSLSVPLYVITIPAGIAFFILSFLVFKTLWRYKSFCIEKPYQFFILLLYGTALVNIAHFYIAGTPYLSGRTALFYIPLFGFTIIGFVTYFLESKVRLSKAAMTFGIISGIFLLANAVNLNHCYEWSYDANTYEVLAFLKKEHEHNPGKVITLSTNWRFYPSFKFYIETEKMDWLKMEEFHNTFKNSSCNYYYTVSEEIKQLEINYYKVLSFDSDERMLMRRK